METHKNTIVDKVFSHIGAFLLLAAGGFSIWGTIEQQVQTAWGASKEGCIAGAVAAYLLGVASGIMLVRHFELSKATIELSELRDSLTSAEKEVKAAQAQLAGKDATIQREKEKNAKLAAILDERKRQEREQAQRDEDADRLLKLTMAEYKVIDGILVAESHGKEYRHSYNTAIGNLYSHGVIEDLYDGKTYVIAMRLRPFFEKYAEAIHEIANGTNEDRLRIAESIRQGTYHGSIPILND